MRLVSGGQVPRDYAPVADLATLVVSILEGPDSADRVFFAATGRSLRTGGDVGRAVRDIVKGAVVEIGDAWTEVDRAELPFRGEISIANARQQLGWAPRYDELDAGIAEYVEQLRAP